MDCGISADLIELKSMLLEAFRLQIGVETISGFLSPAEEHRSDELYWNKYISERWNLLGEIE
jgi:lipoate-protein ligase A